MYKDHETPLFWLTYEEPLRRYLTKHMYNRSAREDVLHDVYVKIFIYCKKHDFSCDKAGIKNLRSWIFQTCHNIMVDFIKANAHNYYIGDFENILIKEPVSESEPLISSAGKFIFQLPSKYAFLVYEDIVLNTKQLAIAQKYGLGLSATKSRIQRGKKMLRELYLISEKK